MKKIWDIFCRVIDNHGDLGVCWRLCADLAQRGHTARLWVDDAIALTWMAPQGATGVQVLAWPDPAALKALAIDPAFEVGDVVVEAFGCELPEAFQAMMMRRSTPVWINLEYLSAEDYVARSHGLASPVMSGPARGATKWFFFPGFTPGTGGLLREPTLVTEHHKFDRAAWLQTFPLAHPIGEVERVISVFCYEPAALPHFLKSLSEAPEPTRLLVAPGRPHAAVLAATQALGLPAAGQGSLQISPLPFLSQTEFDRLLWACDFNLVRGEDSLVRALWAGQPFVWHLYPQEDFAHHDKLRAFTTTLHMPQELQQFHAIWNDLDVGPLPVLTRTRLEDWGAWSRKTRQALLSQPDLTQQLLRFVAQKS